MSAKEQRYLAYMLRLWLVSNGGEPVWRASLESPHTGERLGFASLEALFDSLRAHTGAQSEPGAQHGKVQKAGRKGMLVLDAKMPIAEHREA
ncbi:MAG: hypothetical protein PVG11_02265 [Anaerolineae bacterium]|jgi:hypothetical protein